MAISREQQEKLKQKYLSRVSDVDEKDARGAYEKGRKKAEEMKDDVPGKLKGLWDDLMTMIAMLGDYISGKYRDAPWKTIAAIAGAVLYFASPIDVIPDFIPVAGYIDDAFVIALAVDLIRDDLTDYRKWKEGQETVA